MNSELHAFSNSTVAAPSAAAADVPRSRLFWWTLRRELWESRSIYIAPIAVAVFALFASFVRLISLPHRLRTVPIADVRNVILTPYQFAEGLVMFTTMAVAFFYALDALYGERRDRSILFWKSMPVSDLMTVITKASVPIVVVPLLTFAVTVVLQLWMAIFGSMAAAAGGVGVTTYWGDLSLPQMWAGLLYHLVMVHGLSWAPFFGWLLLVSAFARRAPFLWAVVPPLAVAIVERIAFGTSYFARMLGTQLAGGTMRSMRGEPMMFHIMRGGSLAQPGLWIGLLLTAAFIALAARLRRAHAPG